MFGDSDVKVESLRLRKDGRYHQVVHALFMTGKDCAGTGDVDWLTPFMYVQANAQLCRPDARLR